MALPLLSPVLSVGMTLVDKLFNKEDDRSKVKDHLQDLFDKGDKDQLEAEVAKLASLTQVDLAQVERNKLSLSNGGGIWIDQLGKVGTWAIGFNFMGIPAINFFVNVANSFISPPYIASLPQLDLTDIMTLIGGILGVGGLSYIRKKA